MGNSFNISTGRGGAGNMVVSSEKPSPKIIPQGSHTPNILQPVFSTGRGGAGNMYKNVNTKLTRKAQDVDETSIAPEDDEIKAVESPLSLDQGRSAHSDDAQKGGLRPKKSKTEHPQTVSIGRGGAGNILSPSSSRKSERGSKKSGKSGKQSKPGLWSKVKGFFA
ncbi:LAQU0S05e02014g1_1 [Lachancea quebecensis]|uniref:LAQU0S05e02014g1_1 n=1 Tax=Lachancea quebecensis TaxID=1654605 RepID=A0A0P1KRL2_9SACH|nr:LAQU0S05e02014g1_1 [Lachancea quebecensis]